MEEQNKLKTELLQKTQEVANALAIINEQEKMICNVSNALARKEEELAKHCWRKWPEEKAEPGMLCVVRIEGKNDVEYRCWFCRFGDSWDDLVVSTAAVTHWREIDGPEEL